MEKQTKKKTSMKLHSGMIGNSRRLTLTYAVLVVWIALAVFAIIKDADLYGLAVYFASGLPLILGYLWSETSRPSIKDASEILKNIGRGRGGKKGQDNNFFGGNFYGSDYGDDYGSSSNEYGNNYGQSQQNNSYQQGGDVSIYSDDGSIELKVNQSQLTTLTNVGYVNTNGDKHTFSKGVSEQVKSLISDNGQQQPNI